MRCRGLNLPSLMEKLRPHVGFTSWDYCVIWKLKEDEPRYLEWVGCCCGGATQVGDEDLLVGFPGDDRNGLQIPCRDEMFQHLSTKHCLLLSQMPFSMSLDSGLHAESFMSNQPRWIFDNSSDETIGTRVLIPIAATGVLIEFFVAKHVSEDPAIVEFVMAQCSNLISSGQEAQPGQVNQDLRTLDHGGGFQAVEDNNIDASLTHTNHDHQQPPLNLDQQHSYNNHTSNSSDVIHHHNFQKTWQVTDSTIGAEVNFNLPWDLSFDKFRLSSTTASSPMNLFGTIGGGSPEALLEPPEQSHQHDQIAGHNEEYELISQHQQLMRERDSFMTTTNQLQDASTVIGPDMIRDRGISGGNNYYKQTGGTETAGGGGGADPVSVSVSGCSTDQMVEDDDDIDNHEKVGLGSGRSRSSSTGRTHQSKNLDAERKRRKKLSGRLYTLRALVPNISNMHRAAILGDAIDFVKELQRQVKELQDELEDSPNADNEQEHHNDQRNNNNNNNNNTMSLQFDHQIPNLHQHHHQLMDETLINHLGSTSTSNAKMNAVHHCHHPHSSKQSNLDDVSHVLTADDKSQQMEVQVEVSQIDRNEFFLKVFCEHKPGVFVRLMEAMNSLGLEVTNASVTTFRGLVLNVFKVEKRDNEMVEADDVRDSLLELTRDRVGGE